MQQQPSPYSESLETWPHLPPMTVRDPKGGATTESIARMRAIALAFDAVEAWISASPAARSCWVMDRLGGKWRLGLAQDGERLSAGVDESLAEAANKALQIAAAAGCL